MIRYLEDREKLNIVPLYESCFNDTEEYKKYFFEEILPDNHVAVCEEDGEIKGMLHLIPKSVTMGKLKNHCFYIYGVATDEKYRKQGIMTELLDSVLKDLYQNSELFTYLIPESQEKSDMYRKFGFDYVMDKHVLKSEELRKKPTHALVLRKADYSDLARLAIFAESTMEERYGLFLSKDREYFKNIFSLMDAEGGRVELYFENKIVLGYRIGFDDEVIEEVLDDSIQKMSWDGSDATPYVMARILNIKNMLRLIGTSQVGSVIVKLSDPVIEDNNGTFFMKYERNRIELEKTEKKPDIQVTIGEFSSHVFGYKQIAGLPKMNMKNGFFINDYL